MMKWSTSGGRETNNENETNNEANSTPSTSKTSPLPPTGVKDDMFLLKKEGQCLYYVKANKSQARRTTPGYKFNRTAATRISFREKQEHKRLISLGNTRLQRTTPSSLNSTGSDPVLSESEEIADEVFDESSSGSSEPRLASNNKIVFDI